MSHNGRPSVETAIGNIAVVAEKSTTRKTEKLKSVKIGSPESYYMLAAFCFDLSRKVNYLFRATRDFAPEADPELAQLLIEDNNAINEDGLTWEQRARRAEAIMLRSVGELGEQHEQALQEVAGKGARK
ncbi:MAG: hypothetical protein M3Q37_09875 [Gemmatimonadota bacterium]|nr:hypothetical protein [Gemmatimonadota bacterium]